MLVSSIVPVRFVMGVNRSRSVHFKKSYRLISKRKTDLQSLKFEIRSEKNVNGLLYAVCEISTCKTNRKHERSSTSIWTAFTQRSRCGIGLRCGVNLSAWAVHARRA